MKAVLGNKEYFIDESQKKHYVDRGYDICDEDNTVIAYGRRKTVPYDEYAKVVREISELKEQMQRLSGENDVLRQQISQAKQFAEEANTKSSGKAKPKEETAC